MKSFGFSKSGYFCVRALIPALQLDIVHINAKALAQSDSTELQSRFIRPFWVWSDIDHMAGHFLVLIWCECIQNLVVQFHIKLVGNERKYK